MGMSPIVSGWYDAGCPVDHTGIPHEVKAHIVRRRASLAGLTVLIETGTGFGALLALVLDDFDEIYSCEMQPDFYASSVERFKDERHVHLRLGDSSTELKEMIAAAGGPALFFLDAHFAGAGTARGEVDTPVAVELAAILSSPHRHVIVIDDARLFGSEKDYPTVAWVKAFAATAGYVCETEGDELVLSRT